jgi:CHASE3 domain sensor protein
MMGFRHLSIGRKLGVSFGIIGLLVVVLGGVSVTVHPSPIDSRM